MLQPVYHNYGLQRNVWAKNMLLLLNEDSGIHIIRPSVQTKSRLHNLRPQSPNNKRISSFLHLEKAEREKTWVSKRLCVASEGVGIQLISMLTSTGSTSWAMITNWAFLDSTSVVTVLVPARTTGGLFVGASGFPFARSSALAFSLSFFCCFVSGRYLSSRRNNCEAKME